MSKLFPNRAARRAADAVARKQGADPSAPEDDTDDDTPVSTGRADTPKDDDHPADDTDADGEDDTDEDMSAEDDDDADEDSEMHGKSAVAQARARERARCAAIFAAAGTQHTALAVHAAFHTKMSRDEAVAMLKQAPAGIPAAAAGRASRNPTIGVAPAAGPSRPSPSSSWERSIERANAKR